ncbi:MAG: T9SS type A sorting domain-containing protein [Bacteroidia bacterium]
MKKLLITMTIVLLHAGGTIHLYANAPSDSEETTTFFITALQKPPVLQRVSIYPNPANTNISISLRDIPSAEVVSIRDLKGRLINSTRIRYGDQTVSMDTNHLQPGLYLVEITNRKAMVARAKVMIRR